jgi:hypothetical protein
VELVKSYAKSKRVKTAFNVKCRYSGPHIRSVNLSDVREMCACVRACVCVCVCEKEREREKYARMQRECTCLRQLKLIMVPA